MKLVTIGAVRNHEVDSVAIDEVYNFANNDSDTYEALIKNYVPNLQKKKKAGKYDKTKAVKLLEYYYSNYIRPNMKKPAKYGWDPKLNPTERKHLAKMFVEDIENDFLI